MKKVFKADQVIHLWANQSQDEARTVASRGIAGRYGYGRAVNPGGTSSVWFTGPVLYSYATPVAMLHKGGTVALISSERYSVTTAGQLSAARQATRHLSSFTVPFLGIGSTSGLGRYRGEGKDWRILNRAFLAKQYAGAVAELEKGRRGPSRHDYRRDVDLTWLEATREILERRAETVRDYCIAFGLKGPEFVPDMDAARIVAAKSAIWERHAVAQAAKDAARTAEWKRISAEHERIESLTMVERVAEWRAGTLSRLPYQSELTLTGQNRGAMLRVNGDTVQTSQGAEVPVNDARRACRFILAKYETGEAWQRNGERFPVGAFELDSVSESGEVRAGCHTFERGEVEALAALLTVQS